MKKLLYIFIFTILGITNAQAQDPGFGDEGGGDAQDAPTTPINNIILPLLITGIITSIYYIKKKEKI
ncbi:hypothetical protein [Flavobacterium sp.]|uniref:hypothetical protein n=1 Tax=Flavobacterium sp. TaxID=239 RepID=UPI0040481D31